MFATLTSKGQVTLAKEIRDRLNLDAAAILDFQIWTLKSAFEQDRHAQLIAVRSLLDETACAFGVREAVSAAFALFESSSCAFAD